MRNRTDVGRDGHAIVIENDQQVAVGCAGIVQALKRDATGYGAVADNGDYFVFFTHQIALCCKSQCCGDRRARMAYGKCVVRTFGAQREPADAARLTDVFECFAPSGKHFVPISLMPHIPHNFVLGCVV